MHRYAVFGTAMIVATCNCFKERAECRKPNARAGVSLLQYGRKLRIWPWPLGFNYFDVAGDTHGADCPKYMVTLPKLSTDLPMKACHTDRANIFIIPWDQ